MPVIVDSKLFGVIVGDNEAFAAFLSLIISKEANENVQNLYKEISQKLNKSELCEALSSGTVLDWQEAHRNAFVGTPAYIKNITDLASENTQAMLKERQVITKQPNLTTAITADIYSRIRQCVIRRAFRYQFFVHFNTCAYTIGTSAVSIFKLRAKQEFSVNTSPSKQMTTVAPSPFCPPIKQFPMVIQYEADYVKKVSKIPFPSASHEQPFKTFLTEITTPAVSPKALEGMHLSSYFTVALDAVAQAVFKVVTPLSKCIILQTPEPLTCVIAFSEDQFNIITNASLSSNGMYMSDSSEMVCHAAITETWILLSS